MAGLRSPRGRSCRGTYLHRDGEGVHLPAGVTDDRPGIWVPYVPAEEVERDITALVRLRDHRLVALPEHPWEELKIGAGPAPVRVDEGWLLIHHGVAGALSTATTRRLSSGSPTPPAR
jgi:predicted GH43/DUF377 family glycosyl hydrolase